MREIFASRRSRRILGRLQPHHEALRLFELNIIKSLAERHIKFFRVGDYLQNIYGPNFLCGFLTTSLVLCFIAFQLSTTSDWAIYCFYIFYSGMICSQIFLLCHFSQKIINSNEGAADGIYDSGWEALKTKLSRDNCC